LSAWITASSVCGTPPRAAGLGGCRRRHHPPHAAAQRGAVEAHAQPAIDRDVDGGGGGDHGLS
jgi:hypothetical protein